MRYRLLAHVWSGVYAGSVQRIVSLRRGTDESTGRRQTRESECEETEEDNSEAGEVEWDPRALRLRLRCSLPPAPPPYIISHNSKELPTSASTLCSDSSTFVRVRGRRLVLPLPPPCPRPDFRLSSPSSPLSLLPGHSSSSSPRTIRFPFFPSPLSLPLPAHPTPTPTSTRGFRLARGYGDERVICAVPRPSTPPPLLHSPLATRPSTLRRQ